MLSNKRFGRDYELVITLTTGEVVKIEPEIRVQFEVTKSIRGALNNAKIKIYNLSEDKRKKLIKDKEDGRIFMPFLFKAGYDKLQTIFKGNVWEAFTIKQGAEFVTTISSLDGGFDYINSYTSKVVTSNDPKHIVNDMPNTKVGKITQKRELIRPKVLVGNSAKLIEDSLDEDETYYIDDGVLHIIKDNEVTSDFIPYVSAESGLLETPVKKNQEVTFRTLLNPTLKIGGLVGLNTISATNLNGVYKIITLKYSGDNYGNDWLQEVTCMAIQNYKVL